MASFSQEILKPLELKWNVEEVKSAIAKENLQNAVDTSGNTLLHYASKWDNVIMTQYLLDSGSRVDAQNNIGKTPLILAIESYPSKAIIKMLIKAGACIFKQDKNGNSALKIYGANCEADGEIGEILLGNCNFPSDNQKIVNALHDFEWCKIISLRNADITRQMLDLKYPREIKKEIECGHFSAALCIAALSADVKNVRLLLDYCNAHGNLKRHDYLSSLFALFHGNIAEHCDERIEVLHILLDQIGSLLNAEGIIDKSVGYLLRQGNKDAIEIVIQRGLDLSLEVSADAVGDTAGDGVVHSFARNKNPGVIELLRGRNLDVNVRNDFKETPLMVAAHFGNTGAVDFLLKSGADVNAMDDEGLTALCRAIQHCVIQREMQYRDCVQTLLEHGANALLANFPDDVEATIIDILLEDEQYLVSDLVLSHLALQKALGIPIVQSICNGINSREPFKDDFESSQQELTEKVYQSITLFNLLTTSDRKFERYARNQEIYSKIQNFASEKCKFHYFKTILQKRIRKAIRTVEMREKAASVVCIIMDMDYKRFPNIGAEIASFFNHEDMKNLLDTIPQE